MSEQPGKGVSPASVADRLSIHRNTVYRMIERQELPAARVGRQLRVPEEAITRLLSGEAPSKGGQET